MHGLLTSDLEIRNDAAGHKLGEIDSPCHLFVGSGTGSNEVFLYYGRYRLTNLKNPLTKEEWAALPESVSTLLSSGPE